MSSVLNAGRKPAVNLDWTRNPSAINTSYQRLLHTIDWANTSLGPMVSWERELRQTVLMMMAEVNPVILYWGGNHTMIYNEAYVPLVGSQHPNNLGKDASVVFPDFWAFFDARISEQRVTGRTQVGEASMLLMQRKGYTEEAYFDWMLIPVIGDNGEMLGAYGRPSESTSEVINRRRVASSQELAQRALSAQTLSELWTSIPTALEVNDRDLPLLLVYSVESSMQMSRLLGSQTSTCQLQAWAGIPDEHKDLRRTIDLRTEHDTLASAMLTAWSRGESVELLNPDDDARELIDQFQHDQWRGAGVVSQQYMILPVQTNGVVVGLLVIGLSPYLRLDDNYRTYLNSIPAIVSAQFSRVQLAEEVQKRTTDAKLASLEFQQSESKFSRFAQRSPVGLALTDINGKVYFANEAWLTFTGLTSSTVESSNWISTVLDEDVPMVQEIWNKLGASKTGVTFQVRSKVPFISGHMKSAYRTAMCAIYPDLDDSGEVVTVMGIVLDISEQKWVEEQLLLQKRELQKSELKYRTFAERSPHGVICTDAQGYMTFANDAWHKFYGLKRGEATDPEPWLRHLDEQDRPLARDYFRTIKEQKGIHTVEVRQKRRLEQYNEALNQPEELWLMATGWAEYRPDGEIESIIFWVTDITVQKIAARVLEEKMEEAIRLKTQQERFMDMISHEIRNPLSAILHCGEDVVESMKSCLTSMDSLPLPNDLAPKEGALQTYIRDRVHSALDAANTIMYCVQHQKQIVDDVLTLSKLDSDLLVVTPVPVRPKELLDSVLKIFDAEARAADINMKVESSASLIGMGIDWILLDPNRFLQIVINLVTNAIKFTRNSVIRDIVISVSAQVTRPPPYHDGVKYVPHNKDPKMKSKIAGDENEHSELGDNGSIEDQLYLCFSVTDSGKGLTEKERRSLFNRFAQGSPKTHTEYGGSGLGLFISRQITEMLGGEIGVGTGANGGCKFAFYVKTRKVSPPQNSRPKLPAALPSEVTLPSGTSIESDKADMRPRSAKRPSTAGLTSEFCKRRVLVVEDNQINQKVLCKQLRNRGFDVDAANHGKEALDFLYQAPQSSPDTVQPPPYFDVILCDIEMPIMNGIECVKEIRRLEGNGTLSGHVPIIGVTANVRSKQVSTAIEVGMDGVTTKPYRIDELIAHIDRVCNPTTSLRSQSPAVTST